MVTIRPFVQAFRRIFGVAECRVFKEIKLVAKLVSCTVTSLRPGYYPVVPVRSSVLQQISYFLTAYTVGMLSLERISIITLVAEVFNRFA